MTTLQRQVCSILKKDYLHNVKSKTIKKKVSFSQDVQVHIYECENIKFRNYVVSNYSMASNIISKYNLYDIDELNEVLNKN